MKNICYPVGHCHYSYLGRDLGAGGAGSIAVHPHPIFSQKLFQVHVLQLEQTPITRQGPLPQQGAQEGRLGAGTQRSRRSPQPIGPAIHTQRVLIGVQGLVFVCGGTTRSVLQFLHVTVFQKRKTIPLKRQRRADIHSESPAYTR